MKVELVEKKLRPEVFFQQREERDVPYVMIYSTTDLLVIQCLFANT